MSNRGDSSRLLYVEPDPVYQSEVASACEPEWAVETVGSGEKAMAAIEAVDCVVASDQMPDQDGLSFLQDVQNEAESLPVVLFAAADDLTLQREAFRAGVTDVIYKHQSPGESTDPSAADDPATAADVSDGVAGLAARLDELETPAVDLDGITLDVSRSLMGAADDEVDMKTEWALQSLAEKIDANQCLIYQVDDSEELGLLHGWTDGEVTDTETHRTLFGIGAETVPTEQFPGFASQLQQFEPVCVDVNSLDLPSTDGGQNEAGEDTPDGHATSVGWSDLSDSHIVDADSGTLLALPIVIEWQLSGVIVLTVDRPREWTEEARQRLQAVGELVGHMERRRRQREELQRQNEQLEQFASVISHDLRSPLSVAQAGVEVARRTGEGHGDSLDRASQAHDRMKTLIENLLRLARNGQTMAETDLDTIELSEVVRRSWQTVATEDAKLAVENDCRVVADESRLRQLIENLLRNSVDHGGDELTVRVGTLSNGFYIEDDGRGIAEADREQIFEPGYTTADAGTGYGLEIVRTVAEAHGWEVTVTDSATSGARFEITGVDETAPAE